MKVRNLSLIMSGIIIGVVLVMNCGGNNNTTPIGATDTNVWLSNGNDIYYNSGNIGVGTNNPQEKLDIVGRIFSRNHIFIGNNSALLFKRNDSSTNLYGLASNTNNDLLFYTNGSIRTVITDTGYIGIGTTSPEQKLSVVGIIKSTSGGFQFPDGTIQTTAINSYSLNAANGSSNNVVYVDNNGNVGINTTSPTEKLDVVGRIYSRNHIIISNNCALLFKRNDNSTNFYGVSSDNNNDLHLYTSGFKRISIKDNGYVGIGTSSPTNPLEISNGAYVSTGGVWMNASSKKYKENITDLTTEEADNVLNELKPKKFNYKNDKKEKHIGFIAEEVPELVASKDRKSLSPMDIISILTKVVQEQKKEIEELKQRLNNIENY